MVADIRTLIYKLNYFTEWYDKGTPIITDQEWDKLYFELQEKEKITGLIYPDSPTQTIHYDLVSKLNKSVHDHPMLSLEKTKDKDEVINFIGEQSFVGMFKMDGLTCSLTYENGTLVRAETRGNGIVGEDILHNAKVIKSIPIKIPYKEKLVVDGEIVCCKPDFEPFKDKFKNPRNFAAGSIRLLSSRECASRNLTFVAWDMIEGSPETIFFDGKLRYLANLGFIVVPYVVKMVTLGVENVISAFDTLNNYTEDHKRYPIDGYVFKFNDIEYGNKQGQTDHHFKNAIAYKFYDETYPTQLKYIHWTMGRTGILTPVAVFDPIDIDGSIVERASLHNVSVMREILGKCAYVGEPLQVYKANMIIPQIAEAGPKYDYKDVAAYGEFANDNIKTCPICGGEVKYVTSDDGVISAYCMNPLCEGKLVNRLEHFCGKKGLDIKGLSKATFQKLIDWGWIENLEDVFVLSTHRNEWIKKSGFGIASVDKVLKSIEEHKHADLDAFISAIGIPLIGRTVAKELIKHFKTYEDFRNAVEDKDFNFFTIDNFGPEMNNSLKTFNYSEADRISKILIFKEPVVSSEIKNNILEGKTIVITGKLTTFKNRAELKEVILQHGGKVSDSISGKTSLLINNDVNSTSAKNKAAKTRGIPILSEQDFIQQYIEK